MISATIMADSVSAEGHRLTTFKARYPKFIHGELMTHRVFSRNASSSRAVPTARLLEEVRSDALRATFVWWGKNEPGMQANAELDDTCDPYGKPIAPAGRFGSTLPNPGRSVKALAEIEWRYAAHHAVEHAERMLELGVHKQLVNRLLEPFSHINVVITATEYMNFFGLRLDAGAQPEMRTLAEIMWKEYCESTPILRQSGEWHLPFVDGIDRKEIPIETLVKVSTARCARVSYESFETGKRSTIEEDLKLYDRLMGAQPLHASPAEHQATPDKREAGDWLCQSQHGNFVGWRQHRKFVAGESLAPLPEQHKKAHADAARFHSA